MRFGPNPQPCRTVAYQGNKNRLEGTSCREKFGLMISGPVLSSIRESTLKLEDFVAGSGLPSTFDIVFKWLKETKRTPTNKQ